MIDRQPSMIISQKVIIAAMELVHAYSLERRLEVGLELELPRVALLPIIGSAHGVFLRIPSICCHLVLDVDGVLLGSLTFPVDSALLGRSGRNASRQVAPTVRGLQAYSSQERSLNEGQTEVTHDWTNTRGYQKR